MMSFADWGNSLYSGKKSYQIVGNRKYFIGIGAVMVVISLIGIAIFGVNPSIEFKGGTEFTVSGTAKDPAQAR